MAKKQFEKKPSSETKEIIQGKNDIIYADKIVNFQINSDVTRLHIGVDTSPTQITVTHQIILPTASFLYAMEFMVSQVNENEELRAQLKDGIKVMMDRLE